MSPTPYDSDNLIYDDHINTSIVLHEVKSSEAGHAKDD